ncbi:MULTISPECIES: helix-turn-helix transcriptional regulator [unclassified Acinetobacter]|uniref:helix-turn-helix transcriptional regulator n=1 Tax=unclassified Acinetobacter TaxID=196816 RepID=UPI002577BA63|nr:MULTISPECIES: helix-turn-helix transcriptional regulator [unclassified Acinetobacter]MDM1764557.1 helix-turn-helix transcriptional regulator [Acinetobacter sp. 226-1]MDM1767532.1 helix-turn-helix transcriptional regulator [Acinetobacter sp. 226-4]
MKILDKYYEEVCDLIYQIPLCKDGWINFSEKILTIFDASYMHIQAIDFSFNVVSYSNGVGILDYKHYAEAELYYLRYPINADPRWEQFLDPQRVGWYQCHTHLSEEFVKNSDLYQKILLPIGLRYVATHELIWDEKICIFWSISTSEKRGFLDAQEIDFLNSLLPHLRRIVSAQRHLYELSLDNIVGYNLIDRLTLPIILLSLSGHVVHYNPKMRQYLKLNEAIQIKNTQLCLPKTYQTILNKTLYEIEHAFRYQQEQLEQFNQLKFSVVDKNHDYFSFTISLLVSEKEMSFFGIRPLVMLTFERDVRETLQNVQLNIERYYLSHDILKKIYKLSKREIEVCELFVNRQNLEKIAQRMNITISSMRTYMKNIFLKTECNSQVELMQLLMSISILE